MAYDNTEEKHLLQEAIGDLSHGDEITVRYYPKSRTEVKTTEGQVMDTELGKRLDFRCDRQTRNGYWRIRFDCEMYTHAGNGSHAPFLGWFRGIEY
jgi:hypothetical protein